MRSDLSRGLELCFENLPRANDQVFVELWDKKKLKFQGTKDISPYDKYSSKLVCSTLAYEEILFLRLPQANIQSSALIFATALLMNTIENFKKNWKGGKILYLGSYIGIRDLLNKVFVSGECLEDYFESIHLKRSGDPTATSESSTKTSPIPSIFYSYSPVDVKGVIENINPMWIFIDCFNEVNVKWLKEALEEIDNREIPAIAVSNNSLSHVKEEFNQFEFLQFQWPTIFGEKDSKQIIEITPIVLKGEKTDDISNKLQAAYRKLSKLTSQESNFRLEREAISLAWKFIWNIESLTVPIQLYEQESKNYYYARSFKYLQEALERFIKSLKDFNQPTAKNLYEIYTDLVDVAELFQETTPPFWKLITELCIPEKSFKKRRLIVFGNSIQRQIFTLSLLADCNISEEELAEIGVYLSDAKQIHKAYTSDLLESNLDHHIQSLNYIKSDDTLELIIVGCPNKNTFGYLEEAFKKHKKIDAYIYPFQRFKLKRLIETSNLILELSQKKNQMVFKYLDTTCNESFFDTFKNPKIELGSIKSIEVESQKIIESNNELDFQIGDLDSEVEWLLTTDDQDEGTGITRRVEDNEEPTTLITEQALQMTFFENRKGIFDFNQQLNVIEENGNEINLNKKFVRAIRKNEKILFINGTERQSLYELIISRVHSHPSMAIHVALVNKWQEELTVAYRNWVNKKGSRNHKVLLKELRERGCKITTSLTIKNWLDGKALSPEDKEDLERLAEILSMPFLKKNSNRIFKAAKRLRGKHRSWGIKVNSWIKKSIYGSYDSVDVKLDDELNISINDFRDSLLILRVEEVNVVDGPFLRDNLGKLEKINE